MIAIVALVLLFNWQRESLATLQAENNAARRQVEQLSKAGESVTLASSDDNAPEQKQISELLKLRGEMTQLCEETNEIELLREKNQKLLASLKSLKPTETNAPAKRPEDALPQDIHPRDSWAFRGYDSPDAAVESVCWALANGNRSAFIAAFSPEMQSEFDTDPFLKKMFPEDMKPADLGEFRILDRQTSSDDRVTLTTYSTHKDAKTGDYVGETDSDMVFKKIGGEWKIVEPSNDP
ncbi:MAG TPA: hypothetical protein VH597_07640 [Verrucomicrobiae bacterium]|nr:hypothetical protein [Verrucomicrobiae bacterium]